MVALAWRSVMSISAFFSKTFKSEEEGYQFNNEYAKLKWFSKNKTVCTWVPTHPSFNF
jgi:hypothetical protein